MLLALHRQVRRSHRSIYYWYAHAARRSALPRERFSPLALFGTKQSSHVRCWGMSGLHSDAGRGLKLTHFGTLNFLGEVRSDRGLLLGLILIHIKK